MFKKIVISTLVIILLGAVAVGAYDIATGASTLEVPDINLSANAAGNNRGQGQQQGQGQGQGRGQGQGQQQGQGSGPTQGQGQGQMVPHEWSTFTGTVVSVNVQSLVVDTAEQGQLMLDLGPAAFAEQQGVIFTPGDSITGQGFAESGMYHAAEITNTTTGQSLQLRDPNGRPLWAGGGQGGQGAQSGQQGQSSNASVSQAMANNEWTTVSGTVNSQSQQGLMVDTVDMGQLMLQMGPPWFVTEQGVVFNPGDAVTILGFTGEGATFQAGAITNETTGATLQLRDPNGRPLWAGRGGQGQGGGQSRGGSF